MLTSSSRRIIRWCVCATQCLSRVPPPPTFNVHGLHGHYHRNYRKHEFNGSRRLQNILCVGCFGLAATSLEEGRRQHGSSGRWQIYPWLRTVNCKSVGSKRDQFGFVADAAAELPRRSSVSRLAAAVVVESSTGARFPCELSCTD